MPPITTLCHLFVFGGLGRYTAGQGNILEHRLLLCNRHINLFIGGLGFSLFLPRNHFPLDRLVVAIVDVPHVLWIWIILQVPLDLDLLLVDPPGQSVKVSKYFTDLLFEDFGKSWLHDFQEERLEEIKKQFMVRLLEFDGHVFDTDVNLVDFEEAGTVGLFSGGKLKLEAKTFAAEEDIGDAGVNEGREPLLLINIIADIYERGQLIIRANIKTRK